MIERIVIENFKSLKKVDLKLGQLNLFIGTNASGKSNFFEALRLLRGIAAGLPVKELFASGSRSISGPVFLRIRGGVGDSIYRPLGANGENDLSFELTRIKAKMASTHGGIDYSFSYDGEGLAVEESLSEGDKKIFSYKDNDAFFKISEREQIACYPSPTSGSQVISAYRDGHAGVYKQFVEAWIKSLGGMQFLDPRPEFLREYGAQFQVSQMGEHGEDFASVIRHICQESSRKESYLSWLRELRPAEVEDVKTLSGAVGEPLFALLEKGREFPAPVLSDGTLRFAAIAAAFFQPTKPSLLAIEEIENGIHASRLRLLLELLRSQSIRTQVFATTHSPAILAWLKPEEYATTFLCKRDETTGESRICPLTEIPHFNEVIKRQPISELFAEGWLEGAL